MIRKTNIPIALLVVVTVALASFACSGSNTVGTVSTNDSEGLVVGSSDSKFPTESIVDWISYTDQVSVVTVLSEHKIAANPNDAARGEGLVGREVVLRIDRDLWNRPNAPHVDDTVRVRVWGWVLKDGKERPFTTRGETRVEVGKTYIAPMLKLNTSFGEEWSILANKGSTMPVENGIIVAPEVQADSVAPFVKVFQGLTPTELKGILESTEPDPVAAQYMDLDPVERVNRVFGLASEDDSSSRN